MGDRIVVIRDAKDAAAAAVEGQERRAKRCPDCGMLAGSGLGPHYLFCPIGTAARAALDAADAERAS